MSTMPLLPPLRSHICMSAAEAGDGADRVETAVRNAAAAPAAR
jgi:hypothetical protein